MKKIKFELTEEDIRAYLKQHHDYYKNCEAMFIKYLKDNKHNLTKEMLQILFEKENGIYVSKRNICIGETHNLLQFEAKPSVVEKIDLSGICHILIPTIKYYGQSEIHLNHLYTKLDIVSQKLTVPMTNPSEVLESTIDDYLVCDRIEIDDKDIRIKMGREHCKNELSSYEDFYGEDKVKRIKKLVKERM